MAFFCGASVLDSVIKDPGPPDLERMGWALGIWCLFVAGIFAIPVPYFICKAFDEAQEEDR